jgi:hypothetical protein
MTRAIVACVVAIPLVGCAATPITTALSNKPEVHVETMFTHEGCTVYRFFDQRYHYYVRCQGAESARTLSSASCGKNCSYEDEIPTLSSLER